MAENQLEEFDDLDNLLDDDEGIESGGEFSEELDNLLGGDSDLGDESGEEGGDSELDSFFEDLSTIDDLEVMQEDEDDAPVDDAPAPVEDAPEAAPAAVAEAPPKKEKPKKEPREGGGKLKRMILLLFTLGILGGGGYAIYIFLFPDFEMPWPVAEEEIVPAPEPVKVQPQQPPPPPPQVKAAPPQPARLAVAPPPVRRAARPKRAAAPRGPTYGIQVATCYFQSCVDNYTRLLRNKGQRVRSKTRAESSQSLELISRTAFRDAASARDLSDQINREHRLEGHAFSYLDNESYRISMGKFSDLERANVVKDTLNQQYSGEILFATRLVNKSYKLRTLVTGRYASRAQAESALTRLRKSDSRLRGSFIVKN